LQISPHVYVRPGELRHAEWDEFNIKEAVWRIPAGKMKSRRPHAVPLSRQVLELLEQLRGINGNSRYVFRSLYARDRPMSENTVNAALRRMGYTGDEMTAHGLRATASSLLNESGLWSHDAIERALAHQDQNVVRGIYHRGQHWDERVRMAQWWSDNLDQLRGFSPER
jgi:integrase